MTDRLSDHLVEFLAKKIEVERSFGREATSISIDEFAALLDEVRQSRRAVTRGKEVERVIEGWDEMTVLHRLEGRIVTSDAPAYWGPGSLWNDLLDAIDELKAATFGTTPSSAELRSPAADPAPEDSALTGALSPGAEGREEPERGEDDSLCWEFSGWHDDGAGIFCTRDADHGPHRQSEHYSHPDGLWWTDAEAERRTDRAKALGATRVLPVTAFAPHSHPMSQANPFLTKPPSVKHLSIQRDAAQHHDWNAPDDGGNAA